MLSILRSTLILIVCLCALGQQAVAYNADTEPITLPDGSRFAIFPEYDRSQAYSGNDNLSLKITVIQTGKTQLVLDKCESNDARIRNEIIQITPLSGAQQEPGDEHGVKTTYLYTVNIRGDGDGKEGAYPKKYSIELTFKYADDKDAGNKPLIRRLFSLYVGVRSNGRVKVNTADSAPPEFLTGQQGDYTVELVNNFPDYPVIIRQVEIKSDPPGLIIPATIPMEQRIEPLQRKSFEVHFRVGDMSYKHLLSGFGDSTDLVLSFSYDDTNDRVISDLTQKVKIKVRPSGRVLFFSMLIGVVVGTVLKYVLQHLQRKGIISRKEAVRYATSTIFIGLVVSVIAMVGKVKIVFFETTGSYDVPSVIFVIGLIASVLGAQLLSTWLKSSVPEQPEEGPKRRRHSPQ
jgi:hypothetical protein